ncbi:glycosyltransferase family 4 protein [Atopomonas sediminilitoris]|uniref:glycosyltransferase family 4 protein n=1 Tax=Atopomonas sediminilitoris TaxID=2919919 RepID=UPI001F4DF454|nr:glycosyltransferase family 4 protein [Atopomonas sediminilitoris]MCJ8168340.1 glycosyltransferase family 4 protein [Atopomonas sediminilitoris]
MKIIHICLSSHYTEGMTYQDNQLPDQNAKDGHEVIVVSDCYQYEGARLVKVPEEDRRLPSGVRLVRFAYDFMVNEIFTSKVRKSRKLYGFLCLEMPDVILFHGVAGWEMLSVARYKRAHPEIKLYIDSHEDFHNSGTFWLSRILQYRIFNRFLVKKIYSAVDKFLYLSLESKDFLREMYGLDENSMEFYPLGGNVIPRVKKLEYGELIRKQHGFSREDVIIVHSGKLEPGKRTADLITAFSKVSSPKLKLIIIGSIPEDQQGVLMSLISRDENILYLGWKPGDELVAYLCAADLYFQPGTQSATMQNAICCGTPIALYPYTSHEPYMRGNGYFVSCVSDYIKVFHDLTADSDCLKGMSEASYSIACESLNYKVLASRLYR